MNIDYKIELLNKDDLYYLYDEIKWNDILKLNKNELSNAVDNSWYSVYAYHNNKLVGTGRIVSDGIINSFLCGLCVHSDYRNKGIGSHIVQMLVKQCKKYNLTVQLFCKEELEDFYCSRGFEASSIGMKLKKLDLK